MDKIVADEIIQNLIENIGETDFDDNKKGILLGLINLIETVNDDLEECKTKFNDIDNNLENTEG